MEDNSSQAWSWAAREFSGAELGDERRAARLIRIAAGLAAKPGIAISSCCGKSGAQAICRFLGRPEVGVESVLLPHRQETLHRVRQLDRVIAVQDTSHLDFGGRADLEGAGPIGTSEDSLGLMMHSTLMVSPDKTPVGVAGIQIWGREPKQRGKRKDRRKKQVKEKESQKWLVGLTAAESCTPPGKHLLVVSDRESDVFALFVASRRETTDLLVRLSHNRAIKDEEHEYILDAAAGADVIGEYEVTVAKRSSRAERKATLEIKSVRVMLKPPRHRTPDIPNTPVEVWVIEAKEKGAPEGVEGLHWLLITTGRSDSYESAVCGVRDYTVRWVIEEYHYILKTGCRIERYQIETADRLEPAIAVNAVVAWRLLHLTKTARESPEDSASKVCTDLEAKVLEQWLRKEREKVPERIRTVKDFVMGVAIMGGFLESRYTGRPGPKTIWRGLKRLGDMVLGYHLAIASEFR